MGSVLDGTIAAIQDHLATIGWTALTFLLGTLAGLQLFVARYPQEYGMAIRTVPGMCYLVVRGSLPAVLFTVLHSSDLLKLRPAYSAIVLGLGSEAFLRSRFLLTFKSTGSSQLPSEAAAGPLDFITWLQDFFLNRTGKVLTRWRMFSVGRWYKHCDLAFVQVCHTLDIALPALGNPDEPERQSAAAILAAAKAEYDAMASAIIPPATVSAEMELRCRLKLGYALYYALDRNRFDAISRDLRTRGR